MMASHGRPLRTQQYWNVTFEPEYGRDETYFSERLAELIDESVRLHLVSDVPLGAFLSGGLDSSAVVAAMARHTPGPVKTFSIGFAEKEFYERPHARRVAERFTTEHHELVVEPADVGVIEDIVWHLDEPFGDSSAIPMYMVSKLASEYVTVVLSGDGGDELFAGYDKYRVEQRERRFGQVPAPIRRTLGMAGQLMPEGMTGRNFVRHFALEGWERYIDAATFFDREEQSRLLTADFRAQLSRRDLWREEARRLASAPGDWLSALQYLDLKSYLPLDILTKVDRMSMAHSIEARVPLLDHEVVEFAASIPPAMQLRNGRSKHVFKQALRGTLPDDLIDRPKHGFAVPLDKWFRGSLAGFARDLLLSDRARTRGIFEPAYVEALMAQQRRGRPLDFQVWTLMTVEQWCRLVIDGDAVHEMPRHQPIHITQHAGSIA
jgi:asparagine synthase (glutamine-hydrolysing)